MTPECKPNFDRLSFVKYMKNIGRSYRKQAMELVSACRLFVQAQEQNYQSDIELRRALAAVDKALSCAADAKGKTSTEADEKFQEATELLGDYERKNLFKDQNSAENGKWNTTVFKRMEEAKSKDKSSSTMLSKLKEKFHLKIHEEGSQEPTTAVKFLLRESPTDIHPTVVHQVLSNRSTLQEILWNFSRFKDKKRLTLKQNPHFYKDLPTSPEAYGSGFQTNPIHDFQDVDSVCVLADKPGRVYLETSRDIRAFGNTWMLNEAIIFKDVCGKLEGESIVGECIEDTFNIWYREELPPSPSSLHGGSPMSVTNPHPIATASPTYSVASDWRELILRKGDSQHLRISTKRPESVEGWTLHSPTGSSPSSSGLPSPMQQITFIDAMSISIASMPSPPSISIQIPPSSLAPFPEASYKTAPPVACSPQPPSGPLSEIPPSPPSSLSTPPSQQPPTEALSPLMAPSVPPRRVCPKHELQQGETVSNPSQAPVAGSSSSSVSKTPPEVTNSRIPIGGTTSQSGRDPLGPVAVSSRELGRAAIPAPNSGDNPPSQHVPAMRLAQPQQQARKMNWFQRIQNTFDVLQMAFNEL